MNELERNSNVELRCWERANVLHLGAERTGNWVWNWERSWVVELGTERRRRAGWVEPGNWERVALGRGATRAWGVGGRAANAAGA